MLSLLPKDAGFDARTVGVSITLPIGPPRLSVQFLDRGGNVAVVTGTPECCARLLRLAGYAVQFSSRAEDQSHDRT